MISAKQKQKHKWRHETEGESEIFVSQVGTNSSANKKNSYNQTTTETESRR